MKLVRITQGMVEIISSINEIEVSESLLIPATTVIVGVYAIVNLLTMFIMTAVEPTNHARSTLYY